MPEKKAHRNLQLKIEPDGDLSKKVDAATDLLGMNTAEFLKFSIEHALKHVAANFDEYAAARLCAHEEQMRAIETTIQEKREILADSTDKEE